MLLQLRQLTRGFVAYILLFLLVIAFAIWGINDAFTGMGSQNVAEVGGRKITPAQLSRELDLTLRARRNEGENLSRADAVDAGLHTRLLESMIARNALYAYADKIGVSASDTQVANYIREIPGVLNPVSGQFDEAAYAQFLQQMSYSRPEFEEDVRGDLSSQLLMSALVQGVRAPASFGAIAFAYETETRVVSIAEAPAAAVGNIPQPNEAQLQTFWEESQEQLRVPEFRALTLIYARLADFAARVDVPEQRLREEFEARRAALSQPERRTYVRISAQTQAQANDAAARLARGEAPDAVAAALGLQVTRGENQARAEVPDPRIAEAVFAQARGVARAVQGQLTPWAAVRVDTITPGSSPSFESLRSELRTAIASEEAGDLLNAAIGTYEDARAGGAAPADAARQAGLTVVSIPAVEAGGRDATGAPVEALAGHEEILAVAFQTPESEASDFTPMDDADVVVAVDRIVPASVRPLDDVRTELAQAWVARERGRRMRELGATMIAAVRGGQSFAAAARANGFTMRVTSQAIDRQAASQIPSRGLPPQIFAGAQGAVVTDMRADGGAVLVAQVEAINRANPAEAPQIVEAARAQIEQGLGGNLAESAQAEVVARSNARRNDRLVQQLFQGNTSDDQAQ